jgi:hypothetical protein
MVFAAIALAGLGGGLCGAAFGIWLVLYKSTVILPW